MKEEYYWCLFDVDKISRMDGKFCDQSRIACELLCDEHPVFFRHKLNEKYDVERSSGPKTYTVQERYTLLNWKQITPEEYRLLKDLV